MPPPDLSKLNAPLGPLRDKRVVDISVNDFVEERGFICQVATDGDLTYRTLEGLADQTENGLKTGATVNAGGIPVLMQAVRASSTVTSIVIGIL